MTNDLIRLAIDRACESMGGSDGLFSAAGFSCKFCDLLPTDTTLDGHVVRALLTGRNDVMPLPDGSHYRRIKEE